MSFIHSANRTTATTAQKSTASDSLSPEVSWSETKYFYKVQLHTRQLKLNVDNMGGIPEKLLSQLELFPMHRQTKEANPAFLGTCKMT